MRRIVWLVLPLALLVGGCTKQLDRIETGVTGLQQSQSRLEQRQDAVERELAELTALLEEESFGGRERGAELGARLAQLDRALSQMIARNQEQEAVLRRLSASLDLLLRQAPAARPVVPQEVPDPVAPSTPDEQESGSAPDAAASGGGPGGSPGRDVFDAAFADFTRGSYGLAREGFEELLRRWPESELADDAAYWIAETWYGQGDHRKALEQFESILQRYPGGDTLPPTLLKMGYCYLELGEAGLAADSFRRLQREHPESDEALIAEHKLSSLDGGP